MFTFVVMPASDWLRGGWGRGLLRSAGAVLVLVEVDVDGDLEDDVIVVS